VSRITLVQALLTNGEAVSYVADEGGAMGGLGDRLIRRLQEGRCADVWLYRLFPPSGTTGPLAAESIDIRLLPGGEGSR
jgi:hypothetical protein